MSGWLGSNALENWYGVSADSIGRVTALDLAGIGLTGRFPSEVGLLSALSELRMGDNSLEGPLPQGLARLVSDRVALCGHRHLYAERAVVSSVAGSYPVP